MRRRTSLDLRPKAAGRNRSTNPLCALGVKAYESNDVVISGGVQEGARIVVLGVQKLDPSQKVRVVSSLSF